MAKNLIDGNSYEFVEGTKKTDHEALAQRMTAAEGDIADVENNINTHKQDTDVHLTSAEKAFLNRPFMSYSYFGTGQTEREIALNDPQGNPYNPDIVIVSASGLPTSGFGSGIVKNYTAFGAKMPNDTLCTAGLEFTNTGIKVYNNNALADGAKQFLNETGTDYLIIAFKFLS